MTSQNISKAASTITPASSESEKILARIAKESPLTLLTRLSESESLPAAGRKMLRNDILASNLYTSVVTDKYKTAYQNEYRQRLLKI